MQQDVSVCFSDVTHCAFGTVGESPEQKAYSGEGSPRAWEITAVDVVIDRCVLFDWRARKEKVLYDTESIRLIRLRDD